jgi:hypothetical protein
VTRKRSDTETDDIKHQVPETLRVVQESQTKNDTKLHPMETIQDEKKLSIPADDEVDQPVLTARRIVQKTMMKEEARATPTHTTESLRENVGVKPNAQNIDTRLLLGSDDILTAEAFLTIIWEYNSLNDSPSNEACAYIINSIECRYKTKRAYQNDVRELKQSKFLITADDLTPTYKPAECLASTNSANHRINAVKIQSNTKRKIVKVKFQVNKMNRQTNNGMILNKINPKLDKTTPVQKGILTTTIAAQGDTGANCSATDTIDIIHKYVEFETPQEVGVFSDDETGSTLQALVEGVIKIISDQGSIMNWNV